MELQELKELLGIDFGDVSQDMSLELHLEAATERAKSYADAYDWTSTDPLPGPIKLGIARWVELTKQKGERAGVQSESLAGLTQTFVSTTDDSYYAEVYSLWDGYRKKGVVFRSARRF